MARLIYARGTASSLTISEDLHVLLMGGRELRPHGEPLLNLGDDGVVIAPEGGGQT